MNFRRWVIIALLLVAGMSAAAIGVRWQSHRQWRALQVEQRATILELERFPPMGWDRDVWRNLIVDAHNVWGNVIYSPSHSEVSIEEMQSLTVELDRILAETTPNNSTESVDRVYRLLLQRGEKTEFISAYRDSLRTYVKHRDGEDLEAEPE